MHASPTPSLYCIYPGCTGAPYRGESSAHRGDSPHRGIWESAPQGLKEGATGVEFPDSSGTLKCLGTGVRVKKVAILNVNVYAMALYAEPAGLKAAGGELLDGVFDKAMCLTLARDVRACCSHLLSPHPPS